MTKIIVHNPTRPSLLLSPGESRDRNGPVEPTIDSGVTVVPGQYGNAWNTSVGQVTAPSMAGHESGTMIVRYNHSGEAPVASERLLTTDVLSASNRIQIYKNTAEEILLSLTSGASVIDAAGPGPGEWETLAIRWDGTTIEIPQYSFAGDMGAMLDFGDLRISATGDNAWNGDVESVLIYPFALTDAEIQRIATMDEAWTWQNASLTERTTPAEVEVAFPKGKSGLNIIETKVYESDMFGVTGREIPVTNAEMTSDIDRAGSKTRVDLETVSLDPAYKYSIGPGQWVSVFQEIARENEGIERVQRGVFELGQPTVRSKGQRDHVHNSGNDVVDRLARASVLDTFYTPPRGYVMGDIETAIRMLGITSMGPNLVTNGSFENEGDGWATNSSGGAAVTHTWTLASTPIPDGNNVWRPVFSGGSPQWGYTYTLQSARPLPADAKKLFVSGLVYGRIDHGQSISVRFWDSDSNSIGANINAGSTYIPSPLNYAWARIYAAGDIPEGATSFSTFVFTRTLEQSTGAAASVWDDIQVRPITGDLLPESVLALPENSTQASNRIQHLPGATLLSAVNDRLSSIGMMAVHATPDSKFTSRQARDTATDATVRTFHLNEDVRMIGDVTVERSVTSMYNRVFAIKEDFTTGESMIAIAENDNVSDPWSIHNILLDPKIVTSQDAADLQVLQDLADAELARASVQTSIKFGILPDPALTVYDMIYIDGPPGHRAVGRWAIESIESGLTTDNPLMIIGARRSTR